MAHCQTATEDELGRCEKGGHYISEEKLISVETANGEELWCPECVHDNPPKETKFSKSSASHTYGH